MPENVFTKRCNKSHFNRTVITCSIQDRFGKGHPMVRIPHHCTSTTPLPVYHTICNMYRMRHSAVEALTSCVARNGSASYTTLRTSRQDRWLITPKISFSSEPSGRRQVQDKAQTSPLSHFSQGDEAIKITRIGMFVNVAMAAAKVREAMQSLDVKELLVALWSG